MNGAERDGTEEGGAEQDGAEENFDAVVAEHWSAVHAFAARLSAQPADADDIVQQTFFQAFRGRARFEGRAGVRTWLFRIAIRVAGRVLAERERRPRALVDPAGSADEPLARLQDAEEARAVRAALLELAPIHRLVLTLFTIEGLKQREIAAILECPEGTVWSRLNHARAALQKRLQRHEDER